MKSSGNGLWSILQDDEGVTVKSFTLEDLEYDLSEWGLGREKEQVIKRYV